MDKHSYVIAVDFDGTIVTHDYPNIGMLVPLAKEVINELVDAGHKVFLWTMRDEKTLADAMCFLQANDIYIFSANKSPITPFSSSPKQLAHYYIDDRNIGCPKTTILDMSGERRVVVSWAGIAYFFAMNGILSPDAYRRITGYDL